MNCTKCNQDKVLRSVCCGCLWNNKEDRKATKEEVDVVKVDLDVAIAGLEVGLDEDYCYTEDNDELY